MEDNKCTTPFNDIIKDSDKIVVFSGAGVSTGSNIKDFKLSF